jgi:hypothetical protein
MNKLIITIKHFTFVFDHVFAANHVTDLGYHDR